MIQGKVSIIIPSRNEAFLVPTVNDLLKNAHGDIEIIPVLDGYWPNPSLPSDPRVKILHKGSPEGMRPAINHAARMATGEWLMKIDAHCLVGPGYDEILKADCDHDWLVIPRRWALDPIEWCIQPNPKGPIDMHYLSYPFERDNDTSCGLHGTPWRERGKTIEHIPISDEMSSQGSCWFMHKTNWDRLGEMDIVHYGNFIQEMQELGLKMWLGGGAMKVNKKTYYAHLHKGPKTEDRPFGGRGYSLSGSNHQTGASYATWYWMTDQWKDRVHDLRWLIERFAPVPGWPKDLDAAFANAKRVLRDPWRNKR